MTKNLLTLLRRSAWAPAVVLIVHRLPYTFGWREKTDWLHHFLGGIAIAYFLHHAIVLFLDPKRKLSASVHFLFVFTAACTAALFWELAEFASDHLRGTHIQHSIPETMMDLVYGTLGASLTTALLAAFHRRSHS